MGYVPQGIMEPTFMALASNQASRGVTGRLRPPAYSNTFAKIPNRGFYRHIWRSRAELNRQISGSGVLSQKLAKVLARKEPKSGERYLRGTGEPVQFVPNRDWGSWA